MPEDARMKRKMVQVSKDPKSERLVVTMASIHECARRVRVARLTEINVWVLNVKKLI